MTITIEKKETVSTQVELPVPCFYRNEQETSYIGLLDQDTVVEIISDNYETSIRNFNNKKWSAGLERVKDAYDSYTSCTESEFLNKYAEVEKAMSLNPILKY